MKISILLLGVLVITKLGLAAESHVTPPPTKPEVWIGPPDAPDGQSFRALFVHPEQWAESRRRIDVLAYSDHRLDKQFTDDELRVWLPQIEKWGLKLGLEVGAVKPWGITGQKTFDIQRKKWDRFQSLGGEIYALAMDEPLVCCRAHIHKPDSYAVEETAQFIALVRKHYPDIRIGDTEGYPSIPAADLLAFIDALQARLHALGVRGMDFFRFDVDWCHFIHGNSNWNEVRKLELACRQRKLPFSLIYWAADYPELQKHGIADDETWYVGVMQQGYDYSYLRGAPDQVVIESWVGAPSRSVPETGDWTFTRSVRDFCQHFVKENQAIDRR